MRANEAPPALSLPVPHCYSSLRCVPASLLLPIASICAAAPPLLRILACIQAWRAWYTLYHTPRLVLYWSVKLCGSVFVPAPTHQPHHTDLRRFPAALVDSSSAGARYNPRCVLCVAPFKAACPRQRSVICAPFMCVVNSDRYPVPHPPDLMLTAAPHVLLKYRFCLSAFV